MIGLMEIRKAEKIKGVHRELIFFFLTATNIYLPLLGEPLGPDFLVKAKNFEPK